MIKHLMVRYEQPTYSYTVKMMVIFDEICNGNMQKAFCVITFQDYYQESYPTLRKYNNRYPTLGSNACISYKKYVKSSLLGSSIGNEQMFLQIKMKKNHNSFHNNIIMDQ